jgi:diguanylate cyclase (GGDEF)-like protein
LISALVLASAATFVVPAAVAAAVTLLLLAATVAPWRRRDAGVEPYGALVHDLSLRLERLTGEVTRALEETQEATRRSRTVGELAESIDLDEVLKRTLEAAGALTGADAALVTLVGPEHEPVRAAAGLSAAEAEQLVVAAPGAGRRIRSLTIAYDSEALPPADDPPIASGLAVQLSGEREPIGLLAVFSRSPQRLFSDEQAAELHLLAERAGPALENARRFREVRHLADLDALTGLHNRRYFHETLEREVSRAQRYGRRLALVVLDLDDFKQINDRDGHLAGDQVLTQVAERMRAAIRSADVACRVGGDEFAVILPESTVVDADQLYVRIAGAVAAAPLTAEGPLRLSGGLAELRPGDDGLALFDRADGALYRAKEEGKGRAAADPPDQDARSSDPGDDASGSGGRATTTVPEPSSRSTRERARSRSSLRARLAWRLRRVAARVEARPTPATTSTVAASDAAPPASPLNAPSTSASATPHRA